MTTTDVLLIAAHVSGLLFGFWFGRQNAVEAACKRMLRDVDFNERLERLSRKGWSHLYGWDPFNDHMARNAETFDERFPPPTRSDRERWEKEDKR